MDILLIFTICLGSYKEKKQVNRNRLNGERLTNLVYVQFNSMLLDKHTREKEQGDVSIAKEASKAIGWIVEGGITRTRVSLPIVRANLKNNWA